MSKYSRRSSTNNNRHPYLRDDLWANGHYDFLWKNATQKFKARLNRIKQTAMKKLAIQTLNASHA